jgi:hypothetical protein
MASTLLLELNGLMVLVLGKDRTSVICIDAQADRSGGGHPPHLPTFESDRFNILPASSTPSVAYPPLKAAWDLNGCVMQVYPAGSPPAAHVRPLVATTNPDNRTTTPQAEVWAGTEWLAKLGEVVPGLQLRPDWATAPVVQARIDLSGGELMGMEPAQPPMRSAIWNFGKAAEQIFTTRFIYKLQGDDAGFEFRITGGSRSRVVYLKPSASVNADNVLAAVYHLPMIEGPVGTHSHGGLTHDHEGAAPVAVPGDQDRLADIDHVRACYELFATPPVERPIPRFVKFASGAEIGETASCIPAMFVQ